MCSYSCHKVLAFLVHLVLVVVGPSLVFAAGADAVVFVVAAALSSCLGLPGWVSVTLSQPRCQSGVLGARVHVFSLAISDKATNVF